MRALVTPITTYRTLPASQGMPTTSDVGSAIAANSHPAAPEVTHDSPEQSVNRHRAAAATRAANGGASAMNGPADRSRRRYAIGPAGTATVASGCTRITEMLGPAPRPSGDRALPPALAQNRRREGHERRVGCSDGCHH